MHSPLWSPEGQRTRHVVQPSSPLGVGAGDVAAQLDDQSLVLPEPLEGPRVTPTTSLFAIPGEGEMEVQNTSAHQDVPLDDIMDDMMPSEGLQGVTESIGLLDLHEHGRSPEVDINVNQVVNSPLESVCKDGYLEGILVSAELMEHEELESLGMLVDDVSAESVEEVLVTVHEHLNVDEDDSGVGMRKTQELARKRTKASSRPVSMAVSGDSDEECLLVLMQLEASDGEAGDADHPISINSSWTVSSHTSSRQLSRSPVPASSLGVSSVVDGGDTAFMKQLKEGVNYCMDGYPVVTWNSYLQAQRLLPLKYCLAKDLAHELQDCVNALPQSYRHSHQATVLFEAMIDEAMDDELKAPPISIINEVTDEGVPPWEFVYTNQMWYGDDLAS
ncbi:uncharacterized protein F5891DRAFT_977256 [Suillus fuscotomentosus]|uniref:Uncharacterized protein n=1 Tax=Suillus fuscotomentosus TaxID=1912939 RepID=A0AAD4EE05_9AGAM|nr:uncharacterized protein F5891DRAFT_977256 [Suillus fuscotomentosus]KAG1904402.1 hypothetical protein F5891DRAFT_977256 [Suillus fuscotomentosus]